MRKQEVVSSDGKLDYDQIFSSSNGEGVGLLHLLSTSAIGVVRVSESDEIVDINNSFSVFSGYRLEEIESTAFNDLDISDYEGGLIFGDATVNQLNEEQQIVQIITKDRKKKYAVQSQHDFVDSNGKYSDILFQDVTHLIVDIQYYEYTNKAAKVGGWEYDVINKTFRASYEVYDIHEVGLNSFFEISDPFKFYGKSVQEYMMTEFRDCIINQRPKYFEELPFYSATGKKKWVKLTFTPEIVDNLTIKIFGSLQDVTAEVTLRNELEATKSRFEQLFNHSPNPLLVIRKDDHQILQANISALEFYGYSRLEIERLKFSEICSACKAGQKPKLSTYGNELVKIVENRRVIHFQKSGEKLLVDVFMREAEIDGELVQIVLVNDVESQQQIEDALSRLNEFLSKLIESSPLAIITLDENGNVEMWNRSAEKLFGWKNYEVFGKPIPFVPEEKQNEFKTNLKKGLESNAPFLLEIDRVKKNGDLISLREYVSPIKNNGNRVDRLMLFIEDVTTSKRIKNALVESERNYRHLVEVSNDLIWRLDKDSTISFINRATKGILDYEPKELIGSAFTDLLCKDQITYYKSIFRRVMFGEKFENVEFQVLSRSGDFKYLSGTVYPTYDATGNVIGCTGSASDITHIIEHQHHLEEMLKEKEILIKEIHHRVKNNLAVVSGLLTLQTNSQTDETTILALTESQSRIQSIATIHEKLYQDELFTQIEMRSYLEQLTKDIGATYSSIHRNIRVNVRGDEIYLNVNQAVPFGILTNELVINAFKYAFVDMDEGIITLDLKKNGDEVIFTVSDNGLGLPDDFSLESSSSLGMTLVKSLSMQLEGHLSYWSEKGAHFSVVFIPDK